MYDILIFNARKMQEKYKYLPKMYILSYTTNRNAIKIMLRKLFTPNIQRIESIRAIGAVLQQIHLRFRILLCRLVFAKIVSTTFHASRLHRKNKVIIILAVEVNHTVVRMRCIVRPRYEGLFTR